MRLQRPVIVALIALGLLLSGPAAISGPTETQPLKKQVEALESRVRALEAQLKALEARMGAPTQSGATVAPAAPPAAPAAAGAGSSADSDRFEAEAQAAIMQIPRLADQGKPDEARAKVQEFRNKYGSSKIAGQATYFSHELEIVGKDAPPDWGIEKWFQGEGAIDMSGSKPTLIVFWEEWCPHCKEEMPKLEQLYSTRKAPGIQVIGVTKVTQTSTDAKIQAYLSANKIEFPIAKESGALSTYLDVSGIPAAAIVKSGKVVWRGHPIRITEDVLKLYQ